MTENDRLRQFRLYLKKSQADFGAVCGLKQGSYSDVERGKVNVSGNIKMALNKEYSLNTDWLETGIGDMISNNNTSNNMEQKDLKDELIQTQRDLLDAYREISRLKGMINDGGLPQKRGTKAG